MLKILKSITPGPKWENNEVYLNNYIKLAVERGELLNIENPRKIHKTIK